MFLKKVAYRRQCPLVAGLSIPKVDIPPSQVQIKFAKSKSSLLNLNLMIGHGV